MFNSCLYGNAQRTTHNAKYIFSNNLNISYPQNLLDGGLAAGANFQLDRIKYMRLHFRL